MAEVSPGMPGHIEPRAVGVTQGWRWIGAGFRLFGKNPLIWIAFFLIYLVAEVVFALVVPVLGPAITALLDPVFIAGFMAGCRAQELDEELELPHLFAGFRANMRQLVLVGGMYFLGKLVILTVAFGMTAVIYGPLPSLDWSQLDTADPAQLELVVKHLTAGGGLTAILLLPILMAYWFAPALVLFDGLEAREAMKLSLTACLRNIWPFTVFGIAGAALFIAGTIPFGLGLFAVVPVLFGTSVYTAYRDIFVVDTGPADTMDPGE